MSDQGNIPPVKIDPSGRFKYILVKVSPRSGGEEHHIVRGYARCPFHADIMDTVEEELKQFNMAGECVGGGRIIHDPVDKTIEVFGYSQGYGRADHAIATEVLKKVYPIYKISWKNDGY